MVWDASTSGNFRYFVVEATKKAMTAKQAIEIDPEILGGTPVFNGTRVAIQTLFDHLKASSLAEFLRGYPSVSREQAEVVIALQLI